MEKSVKVATIIAATVLIVALLGLYAFMQVVPAENIVDVTGASTIEVSPDNVGIYFNIESSADNAADAEKNASEIYNGFLTQMVLLGFDREDVKTTGINVYPDYLWNDGERKENGYKATHSVKVEMSSEDFDKVGKILDKGLSVGADFGYINFELSEELENQYKAEALQKATEDARTKAEAIATGLGKRLGDVVRTSDSSFAYTPWLAYDARSVNAGMEESAIVSAVSQITPNEQEINARVSVVYEIK
jgi:uncharacterized protein